jgi:ubiquinone biosynthesis accessory factor UbiK
MRYHFRHFNAAHIGLTLELGRRTTKYAPTRSTSDQNAPLTCDLLILGLNMDKTNFFNDMQAKINQAFENSPAKDIEKNVKAMLTQGFSKLDLVTREEFDIQTQVLAKTRAKLDALEARVVELEALLKKP